MTVTPLDRPDGSPGVDIVCGAFRVELTIPHCAVPAVVDVRRASISDESVEAMIAATRAALTEWNAKLRRMSGR